MPSQFGYTNGTTSSLDALEYHKSSELVIAVTDLIVLVARRDEIVDKKLDSSKVKAFFVPAGTAFEMYATTLHYAPCDLNNEGFKVSVVLPKGTNYPLDKTHAEGEDKLITAKNKWLIGHAEGGLDAGAHIGLVGKNLNLNE